MTGTLPSSTPPSAGRFHINPRAARRAVPWWDRIAYIQRRLIEELRVAIRDLNLKHEALLDFGCADQPYRAEIPASVRYDGADLPGNPQASVTLNPDGTLPVPDASYDVVLSTQVLEHVDDPRSYLAECHRVLRPGGRLLLSTHGHMIYHPDPDDFWRWTGPGLRREVERAGLTVATLTGVVGLSAIGVQFFQDGLYPRIPGRLRPWFTRITQWLIAFLDRRESVRSKELNAHVYIVTAFKAAAPVAARKDPTSS